MLLGSDQGVGGLPLPGGILSRKLHRRQRRRDRRGATKATPNFNAETQRGKAATKAKPFLTQRRRERAEKRREEGPPANLCEPLRPLR